MHTLLMNTTNVARIENRIRSLHEKNLINEEGLSKAYEAIDAAFEKGRISQLEARLLEIYADFMLKVKP